MVVARELVITYGSLALTTANSRLIDGGYKINKTFEKTIVTLSFIISKTTEAAFNTEINAVEDAFRQPFQNLTIVQGAQTILSFSHDNNTGMNANPVITKDVSNADTGRSRRYAVSIEFEMPADNVTAVLADGLRESTIDVRFSSSNRRTVVISGIFTALGGNDARDQYDAIIDTYATAVLSGLDGSATYELVERPRIERDGPDKLLSFTSVYEELIFSQAGSNLDDATLTKQQFSLNLVKNHPGDTTEKNVQRMVTVIATYDVWVAKAVTDLETKWESIKTWIIQQARDIFSISAVALIDESVTLNKDDNRITATLNIRGAIKGNKIIEQQITYAFESTSGKVLVPVWAKDPLAKYEYQGPATKRLIINIVGQLIGNEIKKAEEDLVRAKELLTGHNVIQISSKPTSKVLKRGQEPNTHVITEFSLVGVYEAYNPIRGATSKRSGAPPPSSANTTIR